jgi:hypothetical protein
MVEFDCCECGSHIVAIALDKPPEPPLCLDCVALPGWMDDPVLRRMLDPTHDGVEQMNRKKT